MKNFFLLGWYYLENKIVDFYYFCFSKKSNFLALKLDSFTIHHAIKENEKNFILNLHNKLFNQKDVTLETYIKNYPSSTFVLYKEDKLIGYVVCRFINFFFYKKAWIYSIGIKSEYQGQQLGYLLLKNVLNILQQNDYKTVLLLVDVDNSARFLYKKCNFSEKIKFKKGTKILMEFSI